MPPEKGFITTRSGHDGPRLLFLEPYLAASHKALISGLTRHVRARWQIWAMPGRFFRWRMRGGAACLAGELGKKRPEADGLICSSMLNLAELKGLAPWLAGLPSLVYFHENQLTYPAPGGVDQEQKKKDLFLGVSNITSALAADMVVFNSRFHRDQFLGAVDELMFSVPDFGLKDAAKVIQAKSEVLPVPVDMSPKPEVNSRQGALRLIWNHRWEHDKDPEAFFDALFALADQGLDFKVAVLGQRAARWPGIFDEAPAVLGKRLVQMGPAEPYQSYLDWLKWGDLVVSTAKQEFMGLAVAEAVLAGARPLVPDALAYPEFYAKRFRYQTGELAKALSRFCKDPALARSEDWTRFAVRFTWQVQKNAWQETINRLLG